MKHTKKALKSVFGDPTEALDYLQKVMRNQSAPILFVSGATADEFASWVANVHGNASNSSVDGLIDGKASGPLVIIKSASDITDPAIQAALDAKRNGTNLIIASKERPKVLAYVKDPSFMSVYSDDFEVSSKMSAEEDDMKEELS